MISSSEDAQASVSELVVSLKSGDMFENEVEEQVVGELDLETLGRMMSETDTDDAIMSSSLIFGEE